jgi:filamentous hemagglutinin
MSPKAANYTEAVLGWVSTGLAWKSLGAAPAIKTTSSVTGNVVMGGVGKLSFGADGRKLDFLFNRNIDQSNAYSALRAEGNASRIGIADTAANRAEVTRLFNEAYNNPTTIIGPGKLPGSNVREFFLPSVTGTGSKIQFVEQNGKIITIIAK